MADLNSLGNYDQFIFYNEIELGNMIFYTAGFVGCAGYVYFDPTQQSFYYHTLGCTLSDDSSDIAFYSNHIFIDESEEVNLENEFVPVAFGPFSYEFRFESDLVYLDITNTEGEVATFWANTLSNENFEKAKFLMYPNPVANELHIDSKHANINQVKIYTLNGKKVMHINTIKDQPIDASSLAKGMY